MEANARPSPIVTHNPPLTISYSVRSHYKAVVPYVTLFGLIRRFDVVYLYERSSSLVRLPPVPVQYDYEHLERAAEAIRLLRQKDVLPVEDFYKAIPGLDYADRRWYECLLDEDEDGMVTLSAIAHHLIESEDLERSIVYVHPFVSQHIERMAGTQVGEHLCAMLDRVAEPAWRAGAIHAFSGTDLTCYKAPHSSRRLAGFMEGRVFYACVIYSDHNQYERDLPKRRRSDFSKHEFIPWVSPLMAMDRATNEDQRIDQLTSRLDREETERKYVESQWEEAQLSVESRDRRIAVIEEEKAALEQRLAGAESAIREKCSEIEGLESALQKALRPWWQRLLARVK